MIDSTQIAQWSRLFSMLDNLKGKLDKLDDQLQAAREQQSLMMGRLETIEDAVLWEDDDEEDDDEMEDDDDSFIDDGTEEESGDSEMSSSAQESSAASSGGGM